MPPMACRAPLGHSGAVLTVAQSPMAEIGKVCSAPAPSAGPIPESRKHERVPSSAAQRLRASG